MTKLFALITALLIGACAATATQSTPAEPDVTDMAGVVTEVREDALLMTNGEGMTVQVNLYDTTLFEGDAPAAGSYVHVMYNGMMTRSLPPQINALSVICHSRTGVVTEVSDGSFMLVTDAGEELQVNAPAGLMADIVPHAQVKVFFNGAMTMSLPAQIGAEMIVPAE